MTFKIILNKHNIAFVVIVIPEELMIVSKAPSDPRKHLTSQYQHFFAYTPSPSLLLPFKRCENEKCRVRSSRSSKP